MTRCKVLVIILISLAPILSFDFKRSINSYQNEIKHKEYHLYPSRVNWTEANKLCVSRGMELVSILSEKENADVINAIKEAGHGHIGFWTSGNRLNSSAYVWANGKPATFTDWEDGKPDKRIVDGEEEKCIEIKGFKTFKWNDNFCSHGLYYVCETS